MPEHNVNATVIDWEDGTDLVIDSRVSADPTRVWLFVSDPALCASWFAPWKRVDDTTVQLELDDNVLVAHIVSCEEGDHVLFDTAKIGRLGMSLSGGGEGGTRITLTHTFSDVDEAMESILQFGPVWDTHLRMLCDALGEPRTDTTEGEMYDFYDELVADLEPASMQPDGSVSPQAPNRDRDGSVGLSADKDEWV